MTATRMLIFAAAIVISMPGMGIAQDSRNQGYLVDSDGNHIVPAPVSGLCWHSIDWTAARAVESCDPTGRKAEAPAPRVVASAPPPPKPAAAPKQAPQSKSIQFSADTLFAFDKSVLKPEGRVALDDFARQLGSSQYEVIFVTGHTDRFGSNEYNQTLSERRANAVKDYLAGKDVPANRMTASGKGETQPVTQAGDCEGAKSVKVIACLQPDRRVHVEVTGTQGVTSGSR